MSATVPSFPNTLPDTLNEEVAQLRDFLVLLEQEQQALGQNEIDRLLPLAEDKNRVFKRLSELGVQRNRLLELDGLPADRPGVERWLAQHPEPARTLTPIWREFLRLAEDSHQLNQTNGQLIAMHMAENQRALTVLMNAADRASLYGPDGQSRPLGSGRDLGSA